MALGQEAVMPLVRASPHENVKSKGSTCLNTGRAWSPYIPFIVADLCQTFGDEQIPADVYDSDNLKPLTQCRKAHQRTIYGRLCAVTFVQDRLVYAACTDALSHWIPAEVAWLQTQASGNQECAIQLRGLVCAVWL